MRDRHAEYEANKEAIKARSRAWYAVNRERAAKVRRAYYNANRDKIRDRDLRVKFGITLERYNEILADQGGHCALCPATVHDARGGALAVDHDHETGKVRGLLCGACNHALGKFGDDLARLRRALLYLLDHQ